MDALKIFESEEFGKIRIFLRDGEPWFVAADVCRALDIGNPTMALTRLDEDEKALISIEGLSRGNDSGNIVSESGLYSLILGSRKPEAKAFKRWITHEVIPVIRKTGGYIANSDLFVSTYFGSASEDQQGLIKMMCLNIEAQQRKILGLSAENDVLSKKTLEWTSRELINALVRRYAARECGGVFGFAWTQYKKELLYKHKIGIDSRIAKRMVDSGKKTKPTTLDVVDELELKDALATAVAMCHTHGVDIEDLIGRAS